MFVRKPAAPTFNGILSCTIGAALLYLVRASPRRPDTGHALNAQDKSGGKLALKIRIIKLSVRRQITFGRLVPGPKWTAQRAGALFLLLLLPLVLVSVLLLLLFLTSFIARRARRHTARPGAQEEAK